MIEIFYIWGPDTREHKWTLLGNAYISHDADVTIKSVPPSLQRECRNLSLSTAVQNVSGHQTQCDFLRHRLLETKASGFGKLAIAEVVRNLQSRDLEFADTLFGNNWLTGTGSLRLTENLKPESHVNPTIFGRDPDVTGSDPEGMRRVVECLAARQRVPRPYWPILYGMCGLNASLPVAPTSIDGKPATAIIPLSSGHEAVLHRVRRLKAAFPELFTTTVEHDLGIATMRIDKRDWEHGRFTLNAGVFGPNIRYPDIHERLERVVNASPWKVVVFTRFVVSSLLSGAPVDAEHEVFVADEDLGVSLLAFAPIQIERLSLQGEERRLSHEEIVEQCLDEADLMGMTPNGASQIVNRCLGAIADL